MKMALWAVLLILAAEVLLISTLVPNPWIEKALQKEVQMIKESMGEQEQAWITSRAHGWFKSALVDTNLIQLAHQALIPSEEQRRKSEGFEAEGDWWFGFVADRLEALQRVLYHVFIRFALLLTWMPFMALLLIPAVYDGLNTWKLKRLTFDYASPVLHRWSIKIIFIIIIGMTTLFILPFPLNPMIVPFSFIVLCLFLGLAISNLQKRL